MSKENAIYPSRGGSEALIVSELRSENLPASERFDWWHEMAKSSMTPWIMNSDHRDDFRVTTRRVDLSIAHTSKMTYSSLYARRTERQIRQYDPENYQISVTTRGRQRLAQGGRDTWVGPGDLMIYDSSRPFESQLLAAEGDTVEYRTMMIPKAHVPLPADRIDKLLAVGMPAYTGIGALLVQFLERLVADAHHYTVSDAPRLGRTLVDLVVALLAHELDSGSAVPPESHRRALLLRVQAFIRLNLDDPQLSPAVVAAAHHISIRHLHRLFQGQGITVAVWIRSQRLEACRRDLADPALLLTPIHELAARWGFSHPAAFSRAFHNAFGCSPREYRHDVLQQIIARR